VSDKEIKWGPANFTSGIPWDARYSTNGSLSTDEQIDTILLSSRPIDNHPLLMLPHSSAVALCDLQPTDSPLSQWTGLRPETSTFERDAVIPLRDGNSLRADIFRPARADQGRVPALVVWSPYGKTGSGALYLSCVEQCVVLDRLASNICRPFQP
jgi:predicted acyl esterase